MCLIAAMNCPGTLSQYVKSDRTDPLIVRGRHHEILYIGCKTVLITSPNWWEALKPRFLSSPHPFKIFSTHLLGTWLPGMRQFPSHMGPFTLQHSLAQRKEGKSLQPDQSDVYFYWSGTHRAVEEVIQLLSH